MIEGGREAQVAHVDALVGAVHERRGGEEVHVLLGEEAVRDAVGEGHAERARVGEPGSTVGTVAPSGSASPSHSWIADISSDSTGERLPLTCSSKRNS